MIDKIKMQPKMSIGALVSAIVGLFLLFANDDIKLRLFFVFIGLYLIFNGVEAIITNKNSKDYKNFILPGITVVVGVLMLLNLGKVFFVICALYVLITCGIRILTSKDLKQELIVESPKLIVGGIILLFSFDFVYQLIFIILGIVFVVLSGFLVYMILSQKKFRFNVENIFEDNEKDDDDIIEGESYEK